MRFNLSKGILTALCIAISFSLIAQNTKYRSYKYEWPKEQPVPMEVTPAFSKEDVVILQEKNTIRIDEKGGMYTEKYMRVKIQSEKGAQEFSTIMLPESFDPDYDYCDVPFEKHETIHQPTDHGIEIFYFAARAIKGAIPGDIKVTDKVLIQNRSTGKGIIGDYIYSFSLGKLAVNDELEITYKYYGGNTSSRYFFHGSYPKQDYTLTITYDDNLRYFFFVKNGAEPSDTIIKNPQNPSIGLVWNRKNLPGISHEPGAILHKQLPYVSYYRHWADYGVFDYSKPQDPKLTKVLPYTWTYYTTLRHSYRDKDVDIRLTNKDKNTLGLNRLYESVSDATDTSVVSHFNRLHRVITNDFAYISKYERYKQDNYLYGPGEAADRKILYEEDRYKVYSELLDRTGRLYYAAVMPDKRIEDFDFENFLPPLYPDIVFCLPYSNSFMYYFPKYNRFGYEVNEFPFYMEDVNMVLIPQNIPLVYKDKKNTLPPRFLVSPNSNETQNIRNNNVLVTISLDSAKSNFDARISLTGQFSTMTRGAYLYNFRDSTVNPKYGLHIYDITSKHKTEKTELTTHVSDFPYKTNFKVKYSSADVLKKNDDGTYSLDLSGWFNHIIHDNFSAAGRQLNFYPDFKMQDVYRYRVKFDHPVTVINQNDYEASIDNEFGKYKLKITQVSADEIEIESSFTVTAEMIPAAQTSQVEDIYSKIEKLNKGALKIRLQ